MPTSASQGEGARMLIVSSGPLTISSEHQVAELSITFTVPISRHRRPMKSRREAALPSFSSALAWGSGLRLESHEKNRGWVGSANTCCYPAGADRMGRAQPAPSWYSCIPALSTALLSGALKLLLCQEAEQWGWDSSALRALPAPPACPPPRAPPGGLPFQGSQGAINLRDGNLRSQLWAFAL